MSKVSTKNSYYEPLLNNGVWVGSLEDVSQYESVTINYVSDTTNNVLTIQYSVDGNNFQDYPINVLTEYVENIPIVSKYLRIKFLI